MLVVIGCIAFLVVAFQRQFIWLFSLGAVLFMIGSVLLLGMAGTNSATKAVGLGEPFVLPLDSIEKARDVPVRMTTDVVRTKYDDVVVRVSLDVENHSIRPMESVTVVCRVDNAGTVLSEVRVFEVDLPVGGRVQTSKRGFQFSNMPNAFDRTSPYQCEVYKITEKHVSFFAHN